MTLTDLAQAIHEAYTSAPTVEERWPAAADAALAKVQEILPANIRFALDAETGEILVHNTATNEAAHHEDLLSGP